MHFLPHSPKYTATLLGLCLCLLPPLSRRPGLLYRWYEWALMQQVSPSSHSLFCCFKNTRTHTRLTNSAHPPPPPKTYASIMCYFSERKKDGLGLAVDRTRVGISLAKPYCFAFPFGNLLKKSVWLCTSRGNSGPSWRLRATRSLLTYLYLRRHSPGAG